MKPLVFLGTPAAAAVVLQGLVDAGLPIDHVVTRPDARRGRGSATSFSPVKECALANGLRVVHDLSLIEAMEPGSALGIVVAYGKIIPARILGIVPMINVHFSLLPRWRGAAPVERAILAGDTVTGVCIMDVEPTLDTGAVYARAETAITLGDTAQQLTERLAHMGGELLVSLLPNGLNDPEPQSGEVTYAHKLSPEEFVIDWTGDAVHVDRQVRALPMYTTVHGRRLKIQRVEIEPVEMTHIPVGGLDKDCRVACGRGAVRIITVQPEGKQSMSAADWRRGVQEPIVTLGTVT